MKLTYWRRALHGRHGLTLLLSRVQAAVPALFSVGKNTDIEANEDADYRESTCNENSF